MTIGIGALGAGAGDAIVRALCAVEAVGSGAIGGFVAAAALDGDTLIRMETQRDGVDGLDLDTVGERFLAAPLAALISSGPNRPAPLSDFLAARAGVGLVTGHRMPSARGRDGLPLNRAALERMGAGQPPREAVEAVLAANPLADAGLIAMTVARDAHAANAASVEARPDAGRADLSRRDARVLVLHNAIAPSGSLAALAAEIALDRLVPAYRATGHVALDRGLLVREATETSLVADATGQVLEIRTPQTTNEPTVLDLGYAPPVRVDGRTVGVLLYEPFLLAQHGRLLSADGEARLELPIGCAT